MKQTITESGGLYWVQHSPTRSFLRRALATHRSFTERVRDGFRLFRSLFARRLRSIADAQEKSRLVVGSLGARCISPCLQRMPRHGRRLVVVAR